jgi:hypothetical protein
MNYQVKFKLKNSFFWKTIKNVKGDLVATDLGAPTRVLILDDESRLEIPLEGTQFIFCPKRFLAIKKRMEQEAGQPLPIRTSI